jgi:hypothetical protein
MRDKMTNEKEGRERVKTEVRVCRRKKRAKYKKEYREKIQRIQTGKKEGSGRNEGEEKINRRSVKEEID